MQLLQPFQYVSLKNSAGVAPNVAAGVSKLPVLVHLKNDRVGSVWNKNICNKWQGPALVARSGTFKIRKSINRQRTHTHTEKEITKAPLIAVPIDHREWANTCLLNLILNNKLSSHSLQFVSKYHVFLDSLKPQIWVHTHHNSGPASLYHNAVELEKCKI